VCRVNGNLNLSRAIGDLKYKSNSALPAKDQIITAQPDVRRFTLVPEDTFFVLACDGVWDVLTNQECVDFIQDKLAKGVPPADAACALLDRCLATDPKSARGVGCDNMTAIVIQLHHDQGGAGGGGGDGMQAGAASSSGGAAAQVVGGQAPSTQQAAAAAGEPAAAPPPGA
jgi:protein phosphatase 1G